MSSVTDGFATGNYPRPHAETVALFWSKVDKSGGDSACWPWRGAMLCHKGATVAYGKFAYRVHGKRTHIGAHRFAAIASGTDPGTLSVLHRCDNPPCCNPAHLFLGTQKANTDDMARKGRKATGGRTRNWEESKFLRGAVMEARGALGNLDKIRDLAARYGMSEHAIYKIARGDSFGWVK